MGAGLLRKDVAPWILQVMEDVLGKTRRDRATRDGTKQGMRRQRTFARRTRRKAKAKSTRPR